MITKHWVESLNATMGIQVYRTWGYKDPKTGQYNGMTGALQRKEADIGGNLQIFNSNCSAVCLKSIVLSLNNRNCYVHNKRTC